ncbi:uncharacterized protein EV422DRAFT_544499 [Fimicolochytrium jonesii]|uniref:uncharacterized protein n=1 Tax=Fimicolochytrium jonesii TaxID=1396493 RepID=UPI0022FDEB67|nr:uncharacterized protein EV422DRAFT_544499 [Fimicolochytrium jonesii]KAI8816685.1 hypothetical protein EV422DRAFT_544499 [Fimicolochytrium jonesii]
MSDEHDDALTSDSGIRRLASREAPSSSTQMSMSEVDAQMPLLVEQCKRLTVASREAPSSSFHMSTSEVDAEIPFLCKRLELNMNIGHGKETPSLSIAGPSAPIEYSSFGQHSPPLEVHNTTAQQLPATQPLVNDLPRLVTIPFSPRTIPNMRKPGIRRNTAYELVFLKDTPGRSSEAGSSSAGTKKPLRARSRSVDSERALIRPYSPSPYQQHPSWTSYNAYSPFLATTVVDRRSMSRHTSVPIFQVRRSKQRHNPYGVNIHTRPSSRHVRMPSLPNPMDPSHLALIKFPPTAISHSTSPEAPFFSIDSEKLTLPERLYLRQLGVGMHTRQCDSTDQGHHADDEADPSSCGTTTSQTSRLTEVDNEYIASMELGNSPDLSTEENNGGSKSGMRMGSDCYLASVLSRALSLDDRRMSVAAPAVDGFAVSTQGHQHSLQLSSPYHNHSAILDPQQPSIPQFPLAHAHDHQSGTHSMENTDRIGVGMMPYIS